MALEEKIQCYIILIEELKYFIKKRNNFKDFKAKFYELITLSSVIEKEVNMKYPILAKLLELPLLQELRNYFTKEIFPLTENEVNSNREIYFPLFEEDIPAKLEILKIAYTKVREIISKKGIEIIHEKQYLKEKSKFPGQESLINKVEQQIITYLEQGGKARKNTLTITDRVNPELMHAHIPAPLDDYRIQYIYEKEVKKVTFLRFARGRDLNYSGH